MVYPLILTFVGGTTTGTEGTALAYAVGEMRRSVGCARELRKWLANDAGPWRDSSSFQGRFLPGTSPVPPRAALRRALKRMNANPGPRCSESKNGCPNSQPGDR